MRNNIFGIIAILFAVVIVLAVGAIAAYQFLNQPEIPESGTAFENPTYVLDEQQIDPALAVSLLGGIAPAAARPAPARGGDGTLRGSRERLRRTQRSHRVHRRAGSARDQRRRLHEHRLGSGRQSRRCHP